MNKLYVWDEIDCEIHERQPEDLFRCSAEGGWEEEGFLADGDDFTYGKPVVRVLTNGRHTALEAWCADEREAAKLFMQHKTFRDTMED